MTAAARPAATRSSVLRLQRSLAQATRGATLLRKRREALVRVLFEHARPAVDARRGIEERALAAYRALLEALAAEGLGALDALGRPAREVHVDLAVRDDGGVRAVELASRPPVVRSLAARGTAIGPGDAAAVVAAEQFERLVELLLDVAPEDALMRRLGQELSHLTRLVNTLEQRVAPGLARALADVRRTLEEREREEHYRLRRRAGVPSTGWSSSTATRRPPR